jgi:hypothetical protein
MLAACQCLGEEINFSARLKAGDLVNCFEGDYCKIMFNTEGEDLVDFRILTKNNIYVTADEEKAGGLVWHAPLAPVGAAQRGRKNYPPSPNPE